jgi:hypothetical protein
MGSAAPSCALQRFRDAGLAAADAGESSMREAPETNRYVREAQLRELITDLEVALRDLGLFENAVKQSRRWLFRDVLPEIRRTGGYSGGDTAVLVGALSELLELTTGPIGDAIEQAIVVLDDLRLQQSA